jgi:hypothetical protein
MSHRPLARLAVLVLGVLVPGFAQGAALAPARASDLVTLVPTGKIDCASGGKQLDTRLLADGTTEPFAIPAKQVLVVTSFDYRIPTTEPAGSSFGVGLVLQTPTLGYPLLFGAAFADSNNFATGSVAASAGIAVKPGSALCISGDNPYGVVHGYFAKDK